jgi:hypothetical protein
MHKERRFPGQGGPGESLTPRIVAAAAAGGTTCFIDVCRDLCVVQKSKMQQKLPRQAGGGRPQAVADCLTDYRLLLFSGAFPRENPAIVLTTACSQISPDLRHCREDGLRTSFFACFRRRFLPEYLTYVDEASLTKLGRIGWREAQGGTMNRRKKVPDANGMKISHGVLP